MRRGLILFFLAVACAGAGDVAPWAPFPLDTTNTIYDYRILTNLVEAVNERCAVVTNIEALDHADFTGFVTRAKLELIDSKIAELAPHFIDRSMTNTVNNSAVYNGWFRKYNAGLDVYNFVLASDVIQGLPRLNMPQAFKQAEVGTNIWPITNWWGIITNYPPYQTEEDRVTTYLCRPEWTVVPGRPIVATIAEWRARYIQKPGDPSAEWQWIDGRLNTIDGDPMNWTNWYGGTLPDRPYPFQGRLYEWDGSLPFVEWISTNTDAMPPAPGFVEGTAYQNDGGGDMYRQGILTNEGLSGNFEVTWPARGNGPAQMTNMHMRVKSDAAGQLGLPANPVDGDVLRIWYAVNNPPMYTYSGEEPYSGTTRTWANILWRECLNERYRIINAMRWTTASQSGGGFRWVCVTAAVGQCSGAYESEGWPAITNTFPIIAATAATNTCPLPEGPYTRPEYGVFPGWVERTGDVSDIEAICSMDYTATDQYPRTIFTVTGRVDFVSRYTLSYYWPVEFTLDGDSIFEWYFDAVDTSITDSTEIDVNFARSRPVVTITNTISNLAWAVDYYLFGSNSALAGIDDPEWLPLLTGTVSMAANTYAATGAIVSASVPPFAWQFPASVTSAIDQDLDCPPGTVTFTNLAATTSYIVRAASYLADTQVVWVTNYTYDGWTYKSNEVSDVLDAGRTNRFENRYYWFAWTPADYATNTNAVAYYYYVTNSVLSDDELVTARCSPVNLDSQDDSPSFSAVTIDTVTTNSLDPWDDLTNEYGYGFYPTGQTRIVDGYTNNAGEPQGDLFLTISTFNQITGAALFYDEEIPLYFFQSVNYSQTVAALTVPHSNRWAVVCDWRDLYPGGMPVPAFAPEYTSTIEFTNNVTNAWIMQWEPVIRWDVVGGFQYVD